MQGWKHRQDSLKIWHISGMSLQMQWVLEKYHNSTKDIKELEDKITGTGNESRFTLFLRALQLADEKKEFN